MSYTDPKLGTIESIAPRNAPSLSIVVPCFNEEKALVPLIRRLEQLNSELLTQEAINNPLTLILVDDGSSDRTWELISRATAKVHVRGIKLSRNQGHQVALLAGLSHADSDVVVSMDADLQDDPDAIVGMISAYRSGAEIVFGVRASRESDSYFKRTTARAYYRLLLWLGVEVLPDHADYRLLSRKALDSLTSYEEVNLYLRGLVQQLGFKTAKVTYDRGSRSAGSSKYTLIRMLRLAIDGITSFSVRPLRLITIFGFAVALMSLLLILYNVMSWMRGETIPGWASTILPVYFLGGAHLFALGIIGEYIGKIYQETKRRPRYFVEAEVSLEAK